MTDLAKARKLKKKAEIIATLMIVFFSVLIGFLLAGVLGIYHVAIFIQIGDGYGTSSRRDVCRPGPGEECA